MTRNQLTYWSNQETIRTNKANEAEIKRSNKAREAETKRHNRAMEELSQQGYLLTSQAQAETARSNAAKEKLQASGIAYNYASLYGNLGLGYYQAEEVNRHNVANEQQAYNDLLERNRSNVASESIATQNANTNALNAVTNQRNAQLRSDELRQQMMQDLETMRHNKAVELETNRSNKSQEKLKGADIAARTATSLITTAANVGSSLLQPRRRYANAK